MSFYVAHPQTWIGVPEHWPYPALEGELESPEQWADLLVSEQTELNRLTRDQGRWLRTIALLGTQQASRSGGRAFIFVETWDGPAHIVQLLIEHSARLGTLSLAEYAGYNDPDQLGAPFEEEFVTTSGLIGVRCYRYLPYEPGSSTVAGMVTYAFEAGDYIATLTGGNLDLVLFERLKVEIEPLAASIYWLD